MRPAGQMRPAKLFCPAHGEVAKKQFSYFSCKKIQIPRSCLLK